MVIGIIERNGKVVLKHVPNAQRENVIPFIQKHVPVGSKVYTDESTMYKKLHHTYKHDSVVHSLNVYVAGDVHTNTIENFWSVLKRGLYGVYHQVSDKHFEAYLEEFAARFNTRHLATDDRFEHLLSNTEGGLLYKNLIAD
ncbi:MAG: IS1595 family transposase [Flavobacteriales bacterium]|nr:IS1595 family transposase [Flavobacteriales bacterium]